MKIRIENYDEWCRLLVDDKLVAEGHSTDYIYGDLLKLLEKLGATVEGEYFMGEEHSEAGAFATGPYYGEASA